MPNNVKGAGLRGILKWNKVPLKNTTVIENSNKKINRGKILGNTDPCQIKSILNQFSFFLIIINELRFEVS